MTKFLVVSWSMVGHILRVRNFVFRTTVSTSNQTCFTKHACAKKKIDEHELKFDVHSSLLKTDPISFAKREQKYIINRNHNFVVINVCMYVSLPCITLGSLQKLSWLPI